MQSEQATDRTVLRITGKDRRHFLENLVTKDPVAGGLVYSALLTPQGKYLADFFLLDQGEDILLDIHTSLANGLVRRLTLYKLRADVTIEESDLTVLRGLGAGPENSHPDPRHTALGWRAYLAPQQADALSDPQTIDWDAIRVTHLIPETGIELIPEDSYILEAGFDRLSGVDHRKGCYVGQEVTARMKHKTELRKGLIQVAISGSAPVGTAVTADGRTIGTLFTQSGNRALAHLRFDRMTNTMTAEDATVTPLPSE